MNFLNERLDGSTGPRHKVVQVGANAPTDEQITIIDAAINTQENLCINALAGAAKTSTLIMIANQPAMLKVSTLCLAFNKRIQMEMQERLPSNCVAMTLHSLGLRVWGQYIGKRVKPDSRKMFRLLKELVEKERKDLGEKISEDFGDILKLAGKAKSVGFVPSTNKRKPAVKLFADDEDFLESLDEEPEDHVTYALFRILNASIDAAFEGDVDFDDMVYLPVVYPARYPQYPLTMVDEAQDLSVLNHIMLEKMVGSNRLFAVGDPCQAIYGFRGAHESSMELMRERFHMRELVLSTSFRCPLAVVREAQWRAPHMNAPTWAKPGEVRSFLHWGVNDLPQDAVIICRNNAPLYNMAMRLLINGRFPQILGNDIGKTLVKTLKKLGDPTTPAMQVYELIDVAERKKLSKTREQAKDNVRDFFECLRLFVPKGDTLQDICAYADYLVNSEGPVKLMTGHKSKGLEFHNVFILDRQLCRIDDETRGQDKNVLYVMQTRAQSTLTYITSEGFVPEEV